MNNELFSSGAVARKLNIQLHKINYMISTAAIPEPALRVAGKRVWNADEVAALAEVLTATKGEPARRNDG